MKIKCAWCKLTMRETVQRISDLISTEKIDDFIALKLETVE